MSIKIPPEIPRGVQMILWRDHWAVFKNGDLYYIRGLHETADYVFTRKEWEAFVSLIAHSGIVTDVKI